MHSESTLCRDHRVTAQSRDVMMRFVDNVKAKKSQCIQNDVYDRQNLT